MDPIDQLLNRGVSRVFPNKTEFELVLRSGKKLTVYQGFDPTGTQFHIGHAVGLRKLRQFQDLGHRVIFLIGDFTGMIGDPTGKLSARKSLSREEVLHNAKTYQQQASRILNFGGDNPVEIKYNSEWLAKMSAVEFFQLSQHLTYQQVVERDMFQERIKQGQDISMNEFLYPFMQGYDSVAMDVDVEVGGSDQTFNMLMGRKLMRNILRKEKFVLSTPLLTDASGKKIGKTEGNTIGITDDPNEFYGKIMSLSDDAIVNCFELLTDKPIDEIEQINAEIKSGANPMQYKKLLAFELTKQFNSHEAATAAQAHFESTFQTKSFADIPTISLPQTSYTPMSLLETLKVGESNGDRKRLIRDGAISINDQKITDPLDSINLKPGDIIKTGKHSYYKIII